MKFNQPANTLKTMTTPVLGGYNPNNLPNFDDDDLDQQITAIARQARTGKRKVKPPPITDTDTND